MFAPHNFPRSTGPTCRLVREEAGLAPPCATPPSSAPFPCPAAAAAASPSFCRRLRTSSSAPARASSNAPPAPPTPPPTAAPRLLEGEELPAAFRVPLLLLLLSRLLSLPGALDPLIEVAGAEGLQLPLPPPAPGASGSLLHCSTCGRAHTPRLRLAPLPEPEVVLPPLPPSPGRHGSCSSITRA